MAKFDVYSFHEQYYRKAMKTIEETAGKKYAAFLDEYGEQEPVSERDGWLDWFEQTHPGLYRKYADAIDRAVKLWGNMAPQAMEDFKAAVKIEVEATQWAVDKFITDKLAGEQSDRLRGRQEALTI